MSKKDIIEELAALERKYKITTSVFLSLSAHERLRIEPTDHAYWNALAKKAKW